MEEQSVPNQKIYREHLMPTWSTYVFVTAVLFLAFAFLISLATESAPPAVVGIFCAGPIFVLPLFSLMIKGKAFGQSYTLGCGALTLAFTGLISAILFALSANEDASSGVGLFFFITAPFSLILLIPLFFFVRNGIQKLREALRLNNIRKMAELIQEKGATTFSELGFDLNVAPSNVDNMVDEIQERRLAQVKMYAPFQRVYESQHLRSLQQEMAKLVQAEGQLYLDDLAIEMQTPMQLITEWIYQLVHENRFTGFINWETAVIYSQNAAKLKESSRCPNCNGQLGLDGERVRCTHCNSEILLGGANA